MGFFKGFKDESQNENDTLSEDFFSGLEQEDMVDSTLKQDELIGQETSSQKDESIMSEELKQSTEVNMYLHREAVFEEDEIDKDLIDAILTIDDGEDVTLDNSSSKENTLRETVFPNEIINHSSPNNEMKKEIHTSSYEDSIEQNSLQKPMSLSNHYEKRELQQQKHEQLGNDSEEVTIIAKGTTISGNISSDCSLEILGTIKGDVDCKGKLAIKGSVIGTCTASSVFVASTRIEGSIVSESSVNVGANTIIIGDISGTSAMIAGAVKGNIDVMGAVVIDSSAVIKGNIKALSIQMNRGAIVDGFCSTSYASVDIDNIFEHNLVKMNR